MPVSSLPQLRWLWASALRKLAGWSSVRELELANLGYAEDWRLLRTLQVGRRLKNTECVHCTGNWAGLELQVGHGTAADSASCLVCSG